MANPAHSNNFDFVRVLAALAVVVSHQFALTGLPEPTLLKVHSLGGLGVLVFFSVSGYLVAQSWHADPHLLRFAARRLLRIWPALAVVVLLSICIWGPLVSPLPWREYFRQPATSEYLLNMAFVMRGALPVHFGGNALPYAVNGPLWTIPLELQCYAVLVLLGFTAILRWRWLFVAVTLVLVTRYAIVEARGDILVNDMGWTLEQRFFLEFGLFFAAGVILHSFPMAKTGVRMGVFGMCWALGLLAVAAGRPLLGLLLIVPCTVVMVGTAATPGLKAAGRYGDVSYGLYIFAFPAQQTLIWLDQGRLSWTALFVLTLCACFLLAFASWHLVEKRALQWKPKRPRAPAEPPADFEPRLAPASVSGGE